MSAPVTPEDFGKLLAADFLESEVQIHRIILNIPKLLEWSNEELTTFFQSFLQDYETGFRAVIEEKKFLLSEET